MAVLGCGVYTVYIQETGGEVRLAPLEFSHLRYTRRLDEMSEAEISAGLDQDDMCLEALSGLTPFKHEISIWRDFDEAWVGPVVDPDYNYDGLTINARDLFQWFERRKQPTDRSFVNTDLAEIAQTYAEDALNQEPSPNISIVMTPTGIQGDRAVLARLHRRSADELRELARTGLDFTAYARTLRFGGEEVPAEPLVTLNEWYFEVTSCRLAGLALGNDVTVIGAGTGSVLTPVVGEASAMSVPLVQQVYIEPSILDESSADHAAQTRLDLLKEPPLFITGRLLETAPVSFNDLIPGARVAVRQQVGVKRVDQDMRLLQVQVEVNDQAEEIVSLVLEPLGTTET